MSLCASSRNYYSADDFCSSATCLTQLLPFIFGVSESDNLPVGVRRAIIIRFGELPF